ncbi:aqualysin-1-like [Amphiura filiformis]|uniref:aqualysin-1-like n=1 Tax=Amphiura filiformis TaxID=82378 RepID=UPI003B21FF5E
MLKLLLLVCLCELSLAAPSRLARLEKARDGVPGRYIVKVKLRGLDGVEYVEEDAIVRSNPTSQLNVRNERQPSTQAISWNLDRMDELELPLDGLFDVSPTAGYGVTVYILSGGIRHTHVEFGGRASMHWDFQCANGGIDNQGEGTALASLVGGDLYGVAGGVTLKSVRVMDDFGNALWSDVIAGINSVALASGPRVGLVAMNGGPSTAVDQAVADALLFGAAIVVPAGDDNADACDYSPAREPSAATVSAIDDADTKSSTTNTGSCLDYFCPGDTVPVAWYTSDAATSTVTGSKYAAAHAAGAVAIKLEEGLTPTEALKLPTAPGVKRKGFGSPDAIGLVNNKCC